MFPNYLIILRLRRYIYEREKLFLKHSIPSKTTTIEEEEEEKLLDMTERNERKSLGK